MRGRGRVVQRRVGSPRGAAGDCVVVEHGSGAAHVAVGRHARAAAGRRSAAGVGRVRGRGQMKNAVPRLASLEDWRSDEARATMQAIVIAMVNRRGSTVIIGAAASRWIIVATYNAASAASRWILTTARRAIFPRCEGARLHDRFGRFEPFGDYATEMVIFGPRADTR